MTTKTLWKMSWGVLAVIAVLFPLGGCSEEPPPTKPSAASFSPRVATREEPVGKVSTAELLIGTWVSPGGALLDFKKDGSVTNTGGDGYKLAYKLSQDQRILDILLVDYGMQIVKHWEIVSIDAT